MRLYDYLPSGNGYKVRLALAQLGIPFERVEMDILEGETRTPEFLAKNPNGRIPVLEIEPGLYLSESDAILCYLAEDTELMPDDRLERARVLQWLFFEQYSHEPYIAVLRHWLQHHPERIQAERIQAERIQGKAGELEERQEKGYAALRVMEQHLEAHDYLVAGRYSIADIALYAYTHVASEGGFDLGGFPAIRAWLDRVAHEPRHIPITQG